MISIVLIDDHPIIRRGLKQQLETMDDVRVVGEASNGEEGIELLESLRPEIAVIDMSMGGITGCEVVHQMIQRCPEVRRLIFSMDADETTVLQAFRNGAHGYVLKGSDLNIIVEAVRSIMAGRHYIGPDVSEVGINIIMERATGSLNGAMDSLSPRERDVMRFAAEGHNSQQIGTKLFISPRTVEVHRRNLMRKLRLKTQTELARFAFSQGVLSVSVLPANKVMTE